MGKPEKNVYQFLGSLRLTVPLLFLIIALAIAGSLVPQNLTGEGCRKLFSPFACQILERLQLVDLFHSIWFICLLALLALNLTVCSWQCGPGVLKMLKNPVPPHRQKLSAGVLHHQFHLPARDEGELRRRLKQALEHGLAKPRELPEKDSFYLLAQKGAWSRLAVIFIHAAVLFILAGALVGAVWGYKAFVTVPEGESVRQARLIRNEKTIPLGFQIRCDKFSIDYYPDSCRPREFKSLVSIVDSGETVIHKQPITVNHPLTYKGVRLYQSSYGPAGDPIMDIRVRHRATQEETTHRIRSGAAEPLPNGGFFRVLRFSSCFQNRGPVAVIEVDPGRGESFILPVFYNNSRMTQIHNQSPFTFTLSAFQQPWHTGLQVNRDPGLWLVWSGFFLIAAGLFMAFGFSHQRIWVSVAREEELIRIQVWGESQRHPIAFKRFFGRLCTLLATELEAPQKEKE